MGGRRISRARASSGRPPSPMRRAGCRAVCLGRRRDHTNSLPARSWTCGCRFEQFGAFMPTTGPRSRGGGGGKRGVSCGFGVGLTRRWHTWGMLRRSIAGIAAFAVTLTLAVGCGPDDDGAAAPAQPVPSAPSPSAPHNVGRAESVCLSVRAGLAGAHPDQEREAQARRQGRRGHRLAGTAERARLLERLG